MIREKQCKKCGITKELSEFHRHIDSKDGVRWQCKQCVNSARLKSDKKKDHRKTPFFIKYGVPKETIRNWYFRFCGLNFKCFNEEFVLKWVERYKIEKGIK